MKKIQYLIIVLLCMVAQGTWAQTNVATESELRNAITDGANITLTADITLSEKLTIGNGQTVTIDMNGHKLSRSLSANENYGMVIYVNGGNLTIDDSSSDKSGSIEGGRSYNGAGILCESGSTLIVNGGTFTNNDVSRTESGNQGRGGAIFMNPNTTLTINGGVFDGNSAYQGGAIYLDDNSTVSGTVATATISGAEFKNCWVTGDGGAIYNQGKLTVSNCTFTGNKSTDGGGIYNDSGAQLTSNGSTYTSNSVTEHGGGGMTNYGTLTVNGGTFTNNSGIGNGGGIWTNQNISMKGLVTIKDNTGNGGSNNLYLAGSSVINVTGEFDSDTRIYVSLENYNRNFTSDFRTHHDLMSNFPISDCFKADIEGVLVSLNGFELELKASGIFYQDHEWTGSDTDGHVVATTKLYSGDYTNYSNSEGVSAGWYLLSGTKTYSTRPSIQGDVKFVLADGCNVEFEEGIYIQDGATLTIYGQNGGSGKLICKGASQNRAAIGGNKDAKAGHLVIHGGTIEATGLRDGATAIGGGRGESGGMRSITIWGGNITAKANKLYGGGIGGGANNNTVPAITIYGGTITAKGGGSCSGIGGGMNRGNGTIKIYGGTITANGGSDSAGIGGGDDGDVDNPIIIYGGNVTAYGNNGGAGIGGGNDGQVSAPIRIYGGTVNADASNSTNGAGIGGGEDGSVNAVIEIYGGDVTAIGGCYSAAIGSGKNGNVNAAIRIYGGTVTADGDHDGGSSSSVGIGAGYGNVNDVIEIYGGSVYATGNVKAPGIGAAYSSSSPKAGTVNIYGGYVEATSLGRAAAPIGGGHNVPGGTVNITGGKVKARYSNEYSAQGRDDIDGETTQYDNWTYIGRGGYEKTETSIGTINIGGTMMVSKLVSEEEVKVLADKRVYTCQTTPNTDSYVLIEPCDHSGGISYSDKDDYYHHVNCTDGYCEGYDEAHTKGSDGLCTKCRRGLPARTLTFYEVNEAGDAYATTGTAHYVTEETNFTIPECSSVPGNMEFMGWLQTDEAPDGLLVTDATGLVQAGSVIQLPHESSDRNYYARYKQIWTGSGSGTENDPFLINNVDEWSMLAHNVNTGVSTYSGKHFRLTSDFNTNSMVGNSTYSFQGSFDGDGHTLKVTYSLPTEDCAAPFRYVNGATIKNLTVTGDIQIVNGKYAGSIVSSGQGTNTITDCHASVQISIPQSGANSNPGSHGGMVGIVSNGATTISGCVFDGKMMGSDTKNCGGFVGWTENGATVSITDCLFAPANITVGTEGSATFARCGDGQGSSVIVTNSYYTKTLGTVQGTLGYTVSSGTDGLSLDYGTATVSYSGIKAYSFGLLYDNKFYGGAGQSVTFTPKADISFTLLMAKGSPIPVNCDGTYTVTIESENVTVTAVSETYTLALSDTQANTATIEENDERIADVTITGRTLFKNGSWNTLCLPFHFTADQMGLNEKFAGATVMELDTEGWYDGNGNATVPGASATNLHQTGFDTTDGTLYLFFKTTYDGNTYLNDIVAGKPYIVRWEKDANYQGNESNYDFTPEFLFSKIKCAEPSSVESNDGTVSFRGNFDPKTIGETGNAKHYLYLGGDNNLYYPTATDFKVNSFRAYFQLNGITAGEPSSQPTVRAFSLHFGDDSEQTGITEQPILNSQFSNLNSEWYSLDGRKLTTKPTQKGVYIYKGVKRVIK